MNRGQLKTRVARIVGIGLGTSDDESAEVALLEELANEAVVDLLTRTSVNVRRALVALTAGSSEYDLEDVFLKMRGIKRGTNWLQEQERDMLDAYGFAFTGYNRILLGSPGVAGEQLEVDYTPLPTPMDSDDDDPATDQFGNIPQQFHIALVNYMCWHAADKAGDQQTNRGERYRMAYEGQDASGGPGTNLGWIKAHTNMRGGAVSIKRQRETLRSDVSSQEWVG